MVTPFGSIVIQDEQMIVRASFVYAILGALMFGLTSLVDYWTTSISFGDYVYGFYIGIYSFIILTGFLVVIWLEFGYNSIVGYAILIGVFTSIGIYPAWLKTGRITFFRKRTYYELKEKYTRFSNN